MPDEKGTGGDQAHRGYLTAFYTKTGQLAWRWYVIPGPGEKGNETWKGDSWKFGGGSPWLTGSYDANLNLVYWGTGNAASDLYDGDRVPVGADKSRDVNLYTASVVALDADTGELRWYHPACPRWPLPVCQRQCCFCRRPKAYRERNQPAAASSLRHHDVTTDTP